MKRLLPVLMVFGVFLLVGNQMTRGAENKPIIFGTSPYDQMKATINVSVAIVGKPKKSMELVFQHKQDHTQNFSISFLGCTTSAANSYCNVFKNTKLVATNNLTKDVYNIKLSHPLKGSININAKYNGSNLELENNLDLRDVPNLDQFKTISANISLDNMSAVFNIENERGKNNSGKTFIVDNKFHFIIDGVEEVFDIRKKQDQQVALLLNKLPEFVEWFFKFKKSIYDFSGMSVHKGEILKSDIFSAINAIYPLTPFEGFKVDGETIYRGQNMVIIKPVIDGDFDWNAYMSTGNQSLKDFFNQGVSSHVSYPLMYVDKSTGVPVYLEINSGMSKNKQRIAESKLVMNTEFSKTTTEKKTSLEVAKKECALIGFTIGTEKFGNCVMKLMDRP